MKIRVWSSASTGLLLPLVVAMVVIMVSMFPNYSRAVLHHFQNETDRLALLSFKDDISNDPNGVLNSWNHSLRHCQWEGVTCDTRRKRVYKLSLSGMSLLGSLSPHLGNLSFLMFLDLQDNRFYGEIPRELSRLFRLRVLILSNNTFTGGIQANISHWQEVENLDFFQNHLSGEIPAQLSSLQKLNYLNLGSNNFTGEIPPSFGNLSSLNIIDLAYNSLKGGLPDELGSLKNLSFLALHVNKLTGEIPSSLYNVSTLVTISVARNFIRGKLPDNLHLKMPNLKELGIGGNQFDGSIPISITNCTGLEVIDLLRNDFKGQIPENLGNLFKLRWLNLGENMLGHNGTRVDDFNFITSLTNCSGLSLLDLSFNNLGGQLPNAIANLSLNLTQFYATGNGISGRIPFGFARYMNLYKLALGGNLFSGTIPGDFGQFLSLQGLALDGNQLSGEIPFTLCNITSLYLLGLQGNNFEGALPPCFAKSQYLKILNISRNMLSGNISTELFSTFFSPTYLDISYNSFNGFLPVEVGNLRGITALNCSYNNFSGELPNTIGDLSSLEYLDMQGNFFDGKIPKTLSSLKAIKFLDLSSNNLSGEIPKEIGELDSLEYLNLSFNDLDGEIPTSGVFRNANLVSLAGNKKLCGGLPEFQLPSCIVHQHHKRRHWLIIAMPAVGVVILTFVALIFYCKRRDRKMLSSNEPLRPDKMLRISYQELHRATEGFSPENLIGSGGFGFVYRGRLDQHEDMPVAVKVLDLQKHGASKSFKTECKALRNIRHRNLVAILTYCSSIDFRGHDFKALVYELMENGNLEMWLHQETIRSQSLNMLQRLNIAVDVASALDYLHNHCEVVIAHCDIKPSNILLSKDLTAHMGDFGLARLISEKTISSTGQASSSTNFIKGTIGYAAPEYAMGGKASTKGDIYSLGIVLLEMFTGRKPIDDLFVDGLDLHNYVKTNMAKDFLKIADPFLVSCEREGTMEAGNDNMQKCLISILEIGLKCSATSPNDRMPINDALKQLHLIRDAFCGARTTKVIHHE